VPVDAVVVTLAGLVGAVLGSFLNVCIVRLPLGQSLVRPRSRCPKCQRPIPWSENIPIISWLVLKGRCRGCGQPISIQYPLVELATALMWAGAVLAWGVSLQALAGAILGTILLGISVTDAKHYLIPDQYTIGGLILGVALGLAGGVDGLLDALLGAVVGFGIRYGVARIGAWVFREEAMGGGDIKMMAMVGAFLGWKGVLLTIFAGSALGLVFFVPFMVKKKRHVPFGVFLAMGAAIGFVWGEAIYAWYLHFLRG